MHQPRPATVSVDRGQLKYRVHALGGGWRNWVGHSGINDTVHDCGGNPGQAIDGVQYYYISQSGLVSQAYYRSQTVARTSWLPPTMPTTGGPACSESLSIDFKSASATPTPSKGLRNLTNRW